MVNSYKAFRQFERFFLGLEKPRESEISDIEEMEEICTIKYYSERKEIIYEFSN